MIPIVRIIRLEESFEYGTFGVLIFNTETFCWTLEPSDELNQKNISSIPAQQYLCNRVVSPTFGETFRIANVPLRDHVLFHKGNEVDDTEGCIIVAQTQGKLRGNRAILNSGNTFKAFMKRLEGYQQFHLTIKEVY